MVGVSSLLVLVVAVTAGVIAVLGSLNSQLVDDTDVSVSLAVVGQVHVVVLGALGMVLVLVVTGSSQGTAGSGTGGSGEHLGDLGLGVLGVVLGLLDGGLVVGLLGGNGRLWREDGDVSGDHGMGSGEGPTKRREGQEKGTRNGQREISSCKRLRYSAY